MDLQTDQGARKAASFRAAVAANKELGADYMIAFVRDYFGVTLTAAEPIPSGESVPAARPRPGPVLPPAPKTVYAE
jgi:hypothetical protein